MKKMLSDQTSLPERSRRRFLAWVAAAPLAGCARVQQQAVEGCPGVAGTRIRWIVPYSPGGGYDTYSRLFETPFEKAIGTEIIIDNEPGGGSLIGITQLRDAAPDGRTLGIMTAPGLLSLFLSSDVAAPNPATDFDILGRLESRVHAVVTGANSGLRTMEDVYALQRKRRLRSAVTGVASDNIVVDAVTGALLGLKLDFVAGYPGSQERLLGMMRGECDISSNTYESVQTSVENGDLRVLLQISDGRISDDPTLDGVAWLGGTDGEAARRAQATGRTAEEAQDDAAALEKYLAAGTLVAAPAGLPSDLLTCLRTGFLKAAYSPEFTAAAEAARRSLDIAGADDAMAGVRAAEANARRFAPLVHGVVERIQQGGAA